MRDMTTTQITKINEAVLHAVYMNTKASHSQLERDLARAAEDQANRMMER